MKIILLDSHTMKKNTLMVDGNSYTRAKPMNNKANTSLTSGSLNSKLSYQSFKSNSTPIIFHKFNESRNASADSTEEVIRPTLQFIDQKVSKTLERIYDSKKTATSDRRGTTKRLIIKKNPKYNNNNANIVKSTKMLFNEVGKQRIKFVTSLLDRSPPIVLGDKLRHSSLVDHIRRATNHIERPTTKDIDMQFNNELIRFSKDIDTVDDIDTELKDNDISNMPKIIRKPRKAVVERFNTGRFSCAVKVKPIKNVTSINSLNYSTCTFRVKMKDTYGDHTN